MRLTRRDLLKKFGVGAVAIALPLPALAEEAPIQPADDDTFRQLSDEDPETLTYEWRPSFVTASTNVVCSTYDLGFMLEPWHYSPPTPRTTHRPQINYAQWDRREQELKEWWAAREPELRDGDPTDPNGGSDEEYDYWD